MKQLIIVLATLNIVFAVITVSDKAVINKLENTVAKQATEEVVKQDTKEIVKPTTEEKTISYLVNYEYLDKFVDYLHNNSDAYKDAPQDFMKEQYDAWYTNRGYSDIIIGPDNNLVSTNDDMSIYDILPSYDSLPEGLFILNESSKTVIASIVFSDEEAGEGTITLSGYNKKGETNIVSLPFSKTSNFDKNKGFYSTGPNINFRFNSETQQLEVEDTTRTRYEALENQPSTPDDVQKVLDTYNVEFDGKYQIAYPY